MEDARRGSLGPISSAPQMLELASVSDTHTEYAMVRGRMLECTDRADRARCALSMLLQSCDSFTGHLYALGSAGCELRAVLPEGAPSPELTGWLDARLQLELELTAGGLTTTETVSTGSQDASVPQFLELDGARYEALFLLGTINGRSRFAAGLVVQVPKMLRKRPAPELLRHLASQLLELGDVEGIEVAVGSDTCTE